MSTVHDPKPSPAPPPVLGSDPTDHLAVTLSLQLRAILYRAGLVASPDLPATPVPAVPAGGIPAAGFPLPISAGRSSD